MFQFKTILTFSLLCALATPFQGYAIGMDATGSAEAALTTGMREVTKEVKDGANEKTDEMNNVNQENDEPVSTDDDLKRPDTLTAEDDFSPIVVLKEIRTEVWGPTGKQEATIQGAEASIHKNLLINPDTLTEHNEYLKGGSKYGQKMPDTSEKPGTVNAQRKQYFMTVLRGQALARTLMLKNDKMDKTLADLNQVVAKRDSVREWYQASAVLSTQLDYLQNNLILVRAATVEIESIQAIQGQLSNENSGGILKRLTSAIKGFFK